MGNSTARVAATQQSASQTDDVVKDALGGQHFTPGTFSIDEYKPLKVVVIGAGFSGIIAGISGLSCDIPSHCYQLTFEEKTDWSSFYAPGHEILAYLQSVVDKYKLMRYIKLQHELVHAQYDEPSGKWHLRIRRPAAQEGQFEEFEDTADFFVTAVGALSNWEWPDVQGLKDFKGQLFHSAAFEVGDKTWQEAVKDWKDKKVGVIGVGSSAIQIVPALQPRVAKVCNYVRGKTWLAVPFASPKFLEMMGRDPSSENYAFTDKDKQLFEKDPAFYKHFRHELEADINSLHPSTLRGSDQQAVARALFKANMLKKLAKKPWIADYLMPDFPVACRRLTPGPGYLEALCEDNVEFIPTHIKRITSDGIETVDGKHEDLDVIICATGFITSFQLPFPIIGRNGVDIREKWRPHPTSYLSICVDGFPNMFMTFGPNSGVGSGSLLVLLEAEIGYAVKAAQKMQRERLKSIEIKMEAVRDYDEYLESYFPKTIYTEKCRSWYKMGKEEGRIVALWPGSCLHGTRALANPRWEDYNYELLDGAKNRMYWLGDGQTYNEKTMTGDRAWYLNDEEVDAPPVPVAN
ncbi:putative sterigmatocystin biosynthesis monooxygenase stcW [Grifola frondosa]|uniref:Putative sterigmatocystin biosynthesis monooxygenase stcW n=1 Tax=Grifola frondosa TaxID=5627 RepID=A0A1C7LM68_GRIFR|nr:putative sterigmatocystin biosynthesis monooxygenase stcW [Grifola frondosa]